MNATGTIFRHGIVASLLAGLSVGGLSPCLLAAGDCQSAAPQKTARPCCCHGKCSGHCQMACCQQPAPPQDKAPAPTKLVDNSIAWGLAKCAIAALDAASSRELLRANTPSCIWSTSTDSLLALSIRINV